MRAVFLACAIYLATWPATAQRDAVDDGREATAVEEITVTAQGRREALFDLPDTVTVFDRTDILQRQIDDIEDIAHLTPGVAVINDQDPGTNIITIRGLSTDRLQGPSVAYVIDGIPLADTEFFTARLFDIEQIEVLKGPQGALFGRNAAGGAIAITTQAPTQALSGFLLAERGNGETEAYRASVAGAVIPGKLALRLSGHLYDTGGFITNRFFGTEADVQQMRGLRLRGEATPTDALRLRAIVTWMDEDSGAAWASSNNVTGLNDGRLDGAVLTDPAGDFFGRAQRDWLNIAIRGDWDFDLGRISASLAHDTYEKRWIEELDYRAGPVTLFGAPLFPQGIQPIAQPVDLDIWTGELRWTSPADRRWRFILGGFVQHTERLRVDDFGPLLFGAEPPRIALDSRQWSLFGQVAADVTERLEARTDHRHGHGRPDRGRRGGFRRDPAKALADLAGGAGSAALRHLRRRAEDRRLQPRPDARRDF